MSSSNGRNVQLEAAEGTVPPPTCPPPPPFKSVENPYLKKKPENATAEDATGDTEPVDTSPPTRPESSATSKTSLTALGEYLREFSRMIPRIDVEGFFYKTEGKGRQSVTKREKLIGTSLARLMRGICQDGHIHSVSHPRDRVSKVNGNKPWDSELRYQAQRCFQVPRGTRICLVWPDLFEWDILKHEKAYQTPEGGIKTPCPYCLCNLYVEQSGYTTHERRPRTSIHANAERTCIVAPWYECYNPGCPGSGKKKKELATVKNTDKVLPAAKFTMYTGLCWEQFPDKVKRRYGDYITRLDSGGSTFVTPDLCRLILDNRKTFADSAKALSDAYEAFEHRAYSEYYDFIEDEEHRLAEVTGERPAITTGLLTAHFKQLDKKVADKAKWPKFDLHAFREVYKRLPKKDGVKIIFFKAFDLMEPYLLRDLFSQLPGQIIHCDGTFSLMKRTIDDIDCNGANTVAILVFGEYGNILTFASSDSEANENVQRLIYFLCQRMLRLGGQEAVDAVIGAYTDVCCEGKEDPSQHWFYRMFHNAKFPRKDLFHAFKLVTEETRGPSHPIHILFCTGLRDAILKWEETSLNTALDGYMKDDKGGKGLKVREVAKSQMLGDRGYREGIKNYVETNRSKAERDIWELFARIQAKDQRLAEQAKEKGQGYVQYLKPQLEGVQRGTEVCVENFIVHLRKWCYEDLLSCEEMNLPAEQSTGAKTSSKKPAKLMRLRGTNICKITNRYFNRTGEHASHQGSDVSHAKSLLFVDRHNRERMEAVKHLTNIKPRPLLWFLHEALQKQMAQFVVDGDPFGDESYPPPFDQVKHWEPVGCHFQQYMEWDRVHNEIEKLLRENDFIAFDNSSARLPSSGDATVDDMFQEFGMLIDDADGNEQEPMPLQHDESRRLEAAVAAVASVPPVRSSNMLFGGEVWGRKVGARSKLTLHGAYVDNKLSAYQHEQLLSFAKAVLRVNGNTLLEGIFIEKVVNLWNINHLEELKMDHIGYGGYITGSTVTKFFKDEGNKLIQGDVGICAIPMIVNLPPAFFPPMPPMPHSLFTHPPAMPHL